MIEKYFIEQGLKKLELDDYLSKELDRAGFTKSEIVKTPLVTRIVVNVTRPGLAIGKSGSNITQLTETIGSRFGIDNPQLEIREIESPELDAQAVANKMKALIERGFSWRSIVFKSVNETQKSGAQGLEIILSGKITGKAGRKRKQRIAYGYLKKVGEQAKLVDYGKADAYPKVGAIGIKVKIVHPDTVFPDKEKITDYIKTKEEVVEETTEEKETKSEKEEVKETKEKTEKKPAKEEKTEESPKGKEKPVKEKKEVKEEKKEVKKEKVATEVSPEGEKKEEPKKEETKEKKEAKEESKAETKEEKDEANKE
ncbi:MAG: 30S ribosomal protein S3 [Candidatus Diapherotrites archaeon]|uniref:30S ribosomal protein S3 n=1 Tax=Candidatus Iainarchaeum sp. TaxID=3101447 RepID=A0A2D6LPC3_9ARCH|nr:30S ribosomal protein S3 [Candidatus Diapherotrites archaeon]|tara:strand:+ start:5470 stop:6405 length:936 start_codon:yes stop_codon:yes gene_type:complete